jgi:hypothetical protein
MIESESNTDLLTRIGFLRIGLVVEIIKSLSSMLVLIFVGIKSVMIIILYYKINIKIIK